MTLQDDLVLYRRHNPTTGTRHRKGQDGPGPHDKTIHEQGKEPLSEPTK